MKLNALKTLAGIFVLLAVVTIVIMRTDNKKERGTFKSNLVTLKMSEITDIEISSVSDQTSFKLIKSNDNKWGIMSGDQRFPAQDGAVNNLLYQLTNVKAKQVVAKEKRNWEEFNVTDSLGKRVTIYKNNNPEVSILVGRMSFSQSRNPYQQQPDAVTYLRLDSEETVYAVEGMLSMAVSLDPNDFRDGLLVKCEPQNLASIRFHYPSDTSFVLRKANNIWTINDFPADSSNTHNYLNSIRNFSTRDFGVLSSVEDQTPVYQIQIEGNNMDPVHIKAYATESDEYYATSSVNPGTVLKLNESQINRLFRGMSQFIHKNSF